MCDYDSSPPPEWCLDQGNDENTCLDLPPPLSNSFHDHYYVKRLRIVVRSWGLFCMNTARGLDAALPSLVCSVVLLYCSKIYILIYIGFTFLPLCIEKGIVIVK